MPRPAYKRNYQPKNRPQGGGVPESEGRAVDVRAQMGEYMVVVIDQLCAQQDISISAWVRDACRMRLAGMGVRF